MRHSARRPRYGEASRLVTCACSGAPSSYVGAGIVSLDDLEQRLEVGAVRAGAVLGTGQRGLPGLGLAVDDREVDLLLGGVEVEEQLVGLVDDLGDAGVGTVDLVDDEDDRHVLRERLAQHEAGLRQRALGGVDEQRDAVDHRQAALDLAAEVGVAGGVDDVDEQVLATDRGVLREDGDALLALEVHRVHDAVGDGALVLLVLGVGAGLQQHRVDEGRLAVVDVGDDRDVADVVAAEKGLRGGRHAEAPASAQGFAERCSGPSSLRTRAVRGTPRAWPTSARTPTPTSASASRRR